MAKLSGKLYFVIGLGIVLLSYLINTTREDKSFAVFMVVGAIFIVVGIVKEISSRKKSTEAHETHLRHGTPHASRKK